MIYSRNFRTGRFLYILALLSMTLMTNACMKKPMFVCHPNYFDVGEKEGIGKEIIRLEKDIDQHPENSGKYEPYFHLALLYAHYTNPTPDYPRALSMFEKFLVLDPDSLKKDEVLYMKALVQEVVETDKERMRMANKAAKHKQNNKILRDRNAKLIVENQKLQDAIEKLKLLELMLENKRLNLK